MFQVGSDQTEVVEYKLTDEANEELDRAQVALYRALLQRALGLDAAPVILRFSPRLEETRLDRGESDVLVEQRLVPLLQEMAEWEAEPLRAPATHRRDLCSGCPVRLRCGRAYADALDCRDDPPAGGTRHSLTAEGRLVLGVVPEFASAVAVEPDPEGEAEGRLLRDRCLALLRKLGVSATATKPPRVGPRLVSVDVYARGQVKRLDQAASDVIHSLESEFEMRTTYERPAGTRRFTAERSHPRTVQLRRLLRQRTTWLRERAGRFVVGEGLDGTVEVGDLASPASCHLVVGGMTGSGKSVFLRAMLASLTAFHAPTALRFTLVDPKRVSFGQIVARGLSDYLTGPVCHEVSEALRQLDGLVDEMERRYLLLERGNAEDIDSLNEEASDEARLAHHVVVIDEFAELMVNRAMRQQFVDAVQRLGAKARAAGIHLVLATQRPDAKVVPGIVKANMTGRVALRVQSTTNSRIILDQGGAESLLGNGDLLADLGRGIVRAQTPYVP